MLHDRERRKTEDGDKDAEEERHGHKRWDEGGCSGGQGGGVCWGTTDVSVDISFLVDREYWQGRRVCIRKT